MELLPAPDPATAQSITAEDDAKIERFNIFMDRTVQVIAALIFLAVLFFTTIAVLKSRHEQKIKTNQENPPRNFA